MQLTRIGMDIAKHVFQLHGVDEHGRTVLRKTLGRARVLEFFAQLKPCEAGMEACGGAHYWARELTRLGHTVRLVSAHKVKPYVDGNKNNHHDAAAICEAMSRPRMRFVQPKSLAQQDMQSLHRARAMLVRERTALANQMRGILHEYGIVVPQGFTPLRRVAAELLASDDRGLTPVLREIVAESLSRLKFIEQRAADYQRRIERMCQQDERCMRLRAVEGIGPLSATALVASIGNGREFNNGRHFSAYLGVVPGHSNTGNKTVMLPITKRGSRYLRTLLIHGGRSAVYAARRRSDPKSRWLNRLKAKSGANVAAVALANKNARIAWALLRYGEEYRPARAHAQSSSPPARSARPAEQQPASALQGAAPRSQNPHFSGPLRAG